MPTQRKRAPLSSLQRLAVGFLSVVILLAIGVLLLSIARVRVTITPRPEPIAVDFDLTIIGSGKPSDREVLGRLVRVDGTAEEAATTVAAPTVARVASALTVTLVNTQSAPQTLIATTRLISPEGVQFRTVKSVTIPARGRLANVAVVYDAVYVQPKGIDLSTAVPRKYRIPGLSTWLQERVWGESTGAMQMVSDATPEPARAPVSVSISGTGVRRSAADDAQTRLAALVRAGEESVVLASNSAVMSVGKTTRVVETVTAILIPKGVIETRARAALETVASSSGRTLMRVRPNAFRTRLIAQDPATARVTVAVHAEGDAAIRNGSFAFEPRRIAGFTGEEVRTYLRSLPGVQDVEVQLKPFWVKRVPANVGRVEVDVKSVEE